MPRFFVEPESLSGDGITIRGDDAFHIARSLRMAEGEKITVCLGDGDEYYCELVKIRDSECFCRVIEKKKSLSESAVNITLYMAYPKGDKLETVVQKSVELGASKIVPFESSRCIKRPAHDKKDKILTRLNRISSEAAKQCGRSKLPSVAEILNFDVVCEDIKNEDLILLCYEDEKKQTIKNVVEKYRNEKGIPRNLAIIVGSEGGFSKDEAEKLSKSGAVPVSLGNRILRCETAPDYALSVISYAFEL